MAFLRSSKFHKIMTIVWIVLVIPTMLWWRESLIWIVMMSIYAIIVSHFGAYQAARAEEAVSTSENGTDTMCTPL